MLRADDTRYVDEEVRHQDGRLGVVRRVFSAQHHDYNVLVEFPDKQEVVRGSALRHHTPVCDSTPEDIRALEEHYSQTLDELVAEAERGYA